MRQNLSPLLRRDRVNMEQLILIAHLLIALGIISLIMLQQGKGADMGASFGAGGSQTLFGSDGGGNVLTKATALLVAGFFITSFGLAVVARNKAVSVDEFDLPVPMAEEAAPLLPDDFEIPAVEDDVPESFTTGDEIPNVE